MTHKHNILVHVCTEYNIQEKEETTDTSNALLHVAGGTCSSALDTCGTWFSPQP